MKYDYYKRINKKRHEKLPLGVKIIYILTLITAAFHVLSAFSERFSDIINTNVSCYLRALLAHITNLIQFSVAEFAVILIPVWAFLLIFFAAKGYSESWRQVLVFAGSIFSVICIIYMIFFWGYGVGYGSPTIDKKLGLDRKNVSAEELYETALKLTEKVNEESDNIAFREKDFSVMPYTLSEMNKKLEDAYKTFKSKHNIVSSLHSRIKPVILSDAMSYTHITGVYSFFTGEANLNVAFPDYTLPYTAAHELAHQRGIAREDEANFVAFLVCIGSDDAYIRYSGYQNVLEYVLSALYRADSELYRSAVNELNTSVRYEMAAYSNFFDKYRNSTASKVSGAVNDTYLKLNRTEGEKSYGMVVDLAVAYFKSEVAE